MDGWTYARRLLHAFAEAGQPSSTGPQLFLGPNGGLLWTDAAQVDRSGPYTDGVLSVPEKSAPVVDVDLAVIVGPPEPTGNPVYTTS